MAYFPRVGVELSTQANVRFLVSGTEHDRPAHIVQFGHGARSGRFSTPGPTVNFTVIFNGPDADLAVMTDFFTSHGVITPFTIVHPKFGEGNAMLKLQKHPLEPTIAGDPTWWRIEIPVEGMF